MTAAHVNINKTHTKKRVLVAPLDWGLGHATRCVTLIRELLRQNFDVILAAEAGGADLLKAEFPALQMLPLRGYRVTYSKKRSFFFSKMLLQFPKINTRVKREHQWLKKIVADHEIDIVISDNRYGLWNKNVQSVFITHQLFIKTGNRLTEKIAQKINYRLLKKFDACWIPDEKYGGLAGELSHPEKMPVIPTSYIGTLSRFEKKDPEKNIDLLILLSGPEPQRTIFENLLLKQAAALPLKIILLRGLPSGKNDPVFPVENINVIDHLPAAELNALLSSVKTVVARSGYSTVMDLASTQSTSILIPTPGQVEQEYLAGYLSEKKYCITAAQNNFDLKDALRKLDETDLVPFPKPENAGLQIAVSDLL